MGPQGLGAIMINNYWMSPETTGVNRLPMLNIEHLEKISLDGIWRFQLLESPTDSSRKKWSKIQVPGLWTMQPQSDTFFDKPIYTNVQMPFGENPPTVPAQNPTGIYERDFEIPSSWNGKRIVLHLGGYESVALIHVNDKEVGLTKDSHLAAEFDITPFLERGKNTIRITVVKWSDATFIEDQDHWWHGGISRSVKLYATNKVYIDRLYTTAGIEKDNSTGTLKIEAHIASDEVGDLHGYTLRAYIEELPKVSAANLSKTLETKISPNWTELSEKARNAEIEKRKSWDGTVSKSSAAALAEIRHEVRGKVLLESRIAKINLWSAETPNLYTLNFELISPEGTVLQIGSQKIGFRDVRVVGNDLLVNGQAITIYGVNRHDFNRHTGRVLTRDDMREDLLEMKRWNFNAVRTSHYPNDPAFLDLTDELGFYVIDEANIESHAFYDSMCEDPRYTGAFVERVGRMVQRDIHHPSVILWSLGNESGFGANHRAAATYARSIDPSRPLHYEGAINGDWRKGVGVTDIVCPMYPSLSAVMSYVKSGKQDRPFIMCEYSHAMGNSNGTLAEYWEFIEKTPGAQGGFIWEFWDHGLDQRLPDGSIHAAYGGDFGEKIHDGNFVCDGMVFPDRTAKPAMHEMKSLAAPAVITAKSTSTGKFEIFNKQFFSDLSAFEIRWAITCDGIVLDEGVAKIPSVAPRKKALFSIKSGHLTKAAEKGERFITFTLHAKLSTAWASAMAEIGWSQISLTSRALDKPNFSPSDEFDGVIDEYAEIQLPYGVVAPKLSLWRAPTDNDRIGHISTKWERWGLRELTREECSVTESSNKVTIKSTWKTSTGFAIKHTQVITPIENGFTVNESVVLPKELIDVARVGTNFELSGGLTDLTWFGNGPHESYPDRKIGRISRWNSSIDNQYIPYVRPQENGGHNGMRWFQITDPTGTGLRIDLAKPYQVSVTPNRGEDLADATHDYQVNACGNVVVHIDAAHRGLGTASCGPDTLDKYLISTGTHSWQWSVTTLS